MQYTLLSVFVGLALLGGACGIGTTSGQPTHSAVTDRPLTSQTRPTESGCAQEGSIKSPPSTAAAKITFVNKTDADVTIFWLNFTGAREEYTKLAAKSSYTQDTWVGHVWVAADASGRCLKLHSANAVQQTVVIN